VIAPNLYLPMSIAEKQEIETLQVLYVDIEQAQYIQTIGQGWTYPLQRFMNEQELLEVTQLKTLQHNGKSMIMSMPFTQPVTKEERDKHCKQSRIAIKCKALGNQVLAVVEEPEFFPHRREELCARVFGTLSNKHPKTPKILKSGEFLLSSKSMRFLKRVEFNDGMDHLRMSPEEIHRELQRMGADAVYAYQSKDPLTEANLLLL